MALTEKQNIPNKPIVQEPWTFRKLLGGGITTVAATFTKVFVNPIEWLLAFSILVIALGELIGAHLSIFFYTFSYSLLGCLIISNIAKSIPDEVSNTVADKKKK